MNLVLWCNRTIRFGFLLLFILVPLILTPWNYELFEFNKIVVVYGLTTVIVASWAVKMIAQRQIRIAKTPLDIPLLIFFFSQLISTFFSIDPHVSWFGYYSRFNGGMWSVVCYMLLYYAFVSNCQEMISDTPETIRGGLMSGASRITYRILALLKISVVTAVAVALYGVAERMGIDKRLWVQDVQSRVFSTLGQPNWLAAYLVALVPLPLAFAMRAQRAVSHAKQTWSLGFVIWSLVAALFFIVLLFSRSRSGLAGFAVADAVFLGLYFLRTTEHKMMLPKIVAVHALLFLIVFFNGSYIDKFDKYATLQGWVALLRRTSQTAPASPKSAGPLLEYGGTESGKIRAYVWQGAINAWRSSPKALLIGTGTETFAFAFYQYRPWGHNLTSEWDFLYNKAHNEYLNYLATSGIVGLGSYLYFIGAFIWWFGKHMFRSQFLISEHIQNPKSQFDQSEVGPIRPYLLVALFAGWVSILVTNFFGFSVVITQLFFFLFPAIALAVESDTLSRKHYEFSLRFTPRLQKISAGILILTVLFCLFTIAKYWFADTLFASGYRYNRSGQYAQAKEPLEKAVILNSREPFYHDELGSAMGSLALAALENRDATTAAALGKRSLEESDIALSISPKNVNFWKTRTKIYYSFSTYDAQFNQAAITALQQAQILSPNDPKISYNLAILNGRIPDNQKAIDLLKATITLKPNYRDAYNALYIFYKEVNQPGLARATLQEYLTKVDPADKDFTEKLNQ